MYAEGDENEVFEIVKSVEDGEKRYRSYAARNPNIILEHRGLNVYTIYNRMRPIT